jgi:hypothetical protein
MPFGAASEVIYLIDNDYVDFFRLNIFEEAVVESRKVRSSVSLR